MKKKMAFFPSEHLNILQKSSKEIFNISLLCYDVIYSRVSNLELLLNDNLFNKIEDIFECHTQHCATLDVNTAMMAKYYLDGDMKTIKNLLKSRIIRSIYSDSVIDFSDNFVKDVFSPSRFANPKCKMALPNYDMFFYLYSKLINLYPERVIKKDLFRIISMVQDLLISKYYNRNYNMDTIYSNSHLMLIELLADMPNYSFRKANADEEENISEQVGIDFSSNRIKKYYDDSKSSFPLIIGEKQNRIKLLFSEVVPDLSVIPIEVIYEVKRIDKFKSLPSLAEELSITKEITNEELIKYFNEELWKLAKNSLKVSSSEIVFNILGWIPFEPQISLGIQLFSQTQDVGDIANKYKRNGWVLPLTKLREESKKYYIKK